MSLPLVTRYGADPTRDLEVANKRYVDNSTGLGYYVLGATSNGSAGNTVFFVSPFGQLTITGDSVESEVVMAIRFDSILIRTSCVITANTKNADSLIMFREDGVDRGILTVGAALRGAFDSAVLTDIVLSGDLVNFKRDNTASSSGNLTIGSMTAHLTT